MKKQNARNIASYRELARAINQAWEGVPDGWQDLSEPSRSTYWQRVDRWHQLMAELYGELDKALAAVAAADPAGIEPLDEATLAGVIRAAAAL